MLPATSARHLSIVRPRMAYPPMRVRGLRGASFVKSLPVTFLCIRQANAKRNCRKIDNRALFVAVLYERRIVFLSEISSDGHRPPLQKNAKNYLSLFVCALFCRAGPG